MAEKFNPGEFLREKMQELKNAVGGERLLVACSGGISSNIVAMIIQRLTTPANLVPVLVDTGFMRKNEIELVSETLSRAPIKLNLRIVDARKQFMKGIEKVETATEKRKSFYGIFFNQLKTLAEEEDARIVALGTTANNQASDEESRRTSRPKVAANDHSLDKIEPLKSLNRSQVLKLAQELELPPRLSPVNPFPAPGLLIRIVGRINDEKLKEVREGTAVVEDELQYIKPSQCFAALIEDKAEKNERIEKYRERISDLLDVGPNQVEISVPMRKVAAIKDGNRIYAKANFSRVTLLGSKEILEPEFEDLSSYSAEFIERHKEFARCFYNITRRSRNGKFLMVVRAVDTDDFTQAKIAKLDWSKLHSISDKIMDKCRKVSSVYFDVTPMPPATIELE